jgi:hypothetical protein
LGAEEGKNMQGFGKNVVQGDYQEIGWECMHWIHLPEDRNELWDCVGIVLNSGSIYWGKFLE